MSSKSIDSITNYFDDLWTQAVEIWIAGGWAMIAIAATGLVMFGMGMSIHVRFRRSGFRKVREKTWRRWLEDPSKRKGPIGKLLDFVTGGASLEETAVFFEEIRTAEVAPFERDLKVMKICVGAAPLFGLLGTVTGMLTTFDALASGSGGEKTMTQIADGISEALITTETGLVVALAGLFVQYQLSRTFERYKAFIAHLETVCTQQVYQVTRNKKVKALQSAQTPKEHNVVPRRPFAGATA